MTIQLEEKTLLSRQSLAKRWDYASTKAIERYESEGVITRVKGLDSPRYSIDEIMKIENIGDKNPLSPIAKVRFERKIQQLENELNLYKKKFEAIKESIL